jgi:ADP-heptose:LPS heptosyltransferase
LAGVDALLHDALGTGEMRAMEASRILFTEVIEPLSDAFEPAACQQYAKLFARAIEMYDPGFNAADLLARYERVRSPRSFRRGARDVREVFVLSRVTLGADVAVTSVMLDAARRAFPDAAVWLVGPAKNHGVFAASGWVRRLEAPYKRDGSLRARLDASFRLRELLDRPDSIVIDPDSRLSQLGLVPVCSEENYLFFESRSAGSQTDLPLSRLAADWAEEVLGVKNAKPWVAPEAAGGLNGSGCITMSLGTGGNPNKGLGSDFERGLVRTLVQSGLPVLLDKGAGGEEAERVESAIAASQAAGGELRTWFGPFAPFAAAIARSRLYAGYDSAGQHVAAAAAVPLVTIFHGYPSQRFLHRWRPAGDGPVAVIPAEGKPAGAVLAEVRRAVERLIGEPPGSRR